MKPPLNLSEDEEQQLWIGQLWRFQWPSYSLYKLAGVRDRSEPQSCPGDHRIYSSDTPSWHNYKVRWSTKLDTLCSLLVLWVFFFFFCAFLAACSTTTSTQTVWLPRKQVAGEKTGASSYPVLLCSRSYQRGLIISQRHRWNTFSTVAVYWGACLKLSSRCLHFCTRGMFQGEKL